MLRERSHHSVTEYVKGKHVAVVGNAPGRYENVDDHDIVIRINAAIPPGRDNPNYRGTNTHVLACSVIRPLDLTLGGMNPDWLWWFKITQKGIRGMEEAKRWYEENNREAELYCWKAGSEVMLGQDVGAAPSTGLRVLWLLSHREPASVTTYGMTFWGLDGGAEDGSEESWYSGKQHHESHSPDLEWGYFKKMGYERKGYGNWVKEGV